MAASWMRSGRLDLLVGLCALTGAGCHTEPGATTPSAQAVERLLAHSMRVPDGSGRHPVLPPAGQKPVERVAGGLSVAEEKPSRTRTLRPARVVLPKDGRRPFQVKDVHSGLAVEVALEGAAPVTADVVDGYVVYAGAHPGGDVVHRFTPEGTEDYVTFARAPASPAVHYGLRLGDGIAGLRLVDNTLEALDGSGAPRLRMAPPYLVDADGQVMPARVSVEGCAVDTRPEAPWQRSVTAPGARQCRVRVGWSAEGVKYPAVLDPVWSTTGSLAVARGLHTATTLANGQVLVAGGTTQAGGIAGAELYEPVTGTWAATGSLAGKRLSHVATRLGSGKVLVVAGEDTANATNLRSAELYDPATGTWSPTGVPNQKRRGHGAIVLGDGRVLVAGGGSSSLAAELYDPATQTWTQTGTLVFPRSSAVMALLPDGRVLMACNGGSTSSCTAEVYDPATGLWAQTGGLAVARTRPAGASLLDGRVLVGGGATTAEAYNPTTGTWSTVATNTLWRECAMAQRTSGGRVLFLGGGCSASSLEDRTELYDPATGTWTRGPDVGVPRLFHASTALEDGRVLLVGGVGASSSFLASAELFLPDVSDVTVPTVSFTSPVEGATLEGSVTLTASASDDYAVKRVEFFVDGRLIGLDATAPYSITWYSRNEGNGVHVLSARAYDASGNAGSSSVTITLNNDWVAPTVTFLSPGDGATVEGVVMVSADVQDDRSLWVVEFYDGDTFLGSGTTTAPHSVSWDTFGTADGPHTLRVRAIDRGGNITLVERTVTVFNAGKAAYDFFGLRVPRCSNSSPVCDSAELLRWSGNSEDGAPNTLEPSCGDSYDSPYNGIDRLRVSTLDGSIPTPGKTVRIDATVRASFNSADERLDLYAAPDANNPAWTWIATLTPPAAGTHVLSTTYVLPEGSVQAVRAFSRLGGSTAGCGTGSSYDTDDLVFSVDYSDMVPPAVALTSPAPGASLSHFVTLSASASDNVAVTRVEFLIDGVVLGGTTRAPYSMEWFTRYEAAGVHTLTVRAWDTRGNFTESSPVQVTVDQTLVATYDTALGAPRCTKLGAPACDSGPLLEGKSSGDEPNAPNTVDTCVDGPYRVGYPYTSAVTRLQVSSLDGSGITGMRPLRIDATVQQGTSSDVLYLYYSPEAYSPSWSLIGTLTPAGIYSQRQVLSTTYVPQWSWRPVVRAVYRPGGAASPCPNDGYAGVDDLVLNFGY